MTSKGFLQPLWRSLFPMTAFYGAWLKLLPNRNVCSLQHRLRPYLAYLVSQSAVWQRSWEVSAKTVTMAKAIGFSVKKDLLTGIVTFRLLGYIVL